MRVGVPAGSSFRTEDPALETASPAAASIAVAAAVRGSPTVWRLLGASTHAWWCGHDDDVVVITDDQAVRLPNGIISFRGYGLASLRAEPGDEVMIGADGVTIDDGRWRIVRWWDPAVPPIPGHPGPIAQLTAQALRHTDPQADESFAWALELGDPAAAIDSAQGSLGRGGGLTPEADDFILGAVAGYRHVCASIGDAAGATLLAAIRGDVLAAAHWATTRLSYVLLRHAFAGEVAAPVGALLRALTGRGDLDAALTATNDIGGSSGRALARGTLCGAAAACGVQR
jgi:hypothetical protein